MPNPQSKYAALQRPLRRLNMSEHAQFTSCPNAATSAQLHSRTKLIPRKSGCSMSDDVQPEAQKPQENRRLTAHCGFVPDRTLRKPRAPRHTFAAFTLSASGPGLAGSPGSSRPTTTT